MPDRNSIIEKIKALFAKTKENGATEAEMLSAFDKAQAMMDAYDITDAEVRALKAEAATHFAEPPDTEDPHKIKWRLSYAVHKFCGVEIYRHGREGGLRFIGMPSDIQFAQWLLDNLADFVFEETYKHLLGCCAPKAERQVIIRSFTAACCERIAERILALVEGSKWERTTNGRELVLVKGAAIKAYMSEHGIHLRTCSGGSSPKNVDGAAQAAGRAAGDRASLGRPVSGPAGSLRIGRAWP
jgi:Protein of unknown function (DUF2786)